MTIERAIRSLVHRPGPSAATARSATPRALWWRPGSVLRILLASADDLAVTPIATESVAIKVASVAVDGVVTRARASEGR